MRIRLIIKKSGVRILPGAFSLFLYKAFKRPVDSMLMNFFELAGLLETTDLRSQLQMEKLTKSAEGSYLTFSISCLSLSLR